MYYIAVHHLLLHYAICPRQHNTLFARTHCLLHHLRVAYHSSGRLCALTLINSVVVGLHVAPPASTHCYFDCTACEGAFACVLLNEHILQRVAPLSEEMPEDEAQAKRPSTVGADYYDATAKAYFAELAKAWNVEMSAVAK